MADFENPYQVPETAIVPEASHSTGITMTEPMFQYLNEASPWLRFIGILGYIGCGFMLLSGLIASIGMAAASSFFGDLGSFPTWVFALVYIPMGVFYFFPAHFTYKFGQKIRDYKFSHSIEDLEQAFKNNKSLWKFYGIICIIALAAIPLIFILAIAGGIVAALNVL